MVFCSCRHLSLYNPNKYIMCWPLIGSPRLEGGIEVLERVQRYPGEPRLKRVNFVQRHSRHDTDEWNLIRPASSLKSSRGSYRHEMVQQPWQQPQHFPPMQQHPQPILHRPLPPPPLGFHGPGHHQQFLEPQRQPFHEVAPGIQALHEGPFEDFPHPRGGELPPNIIYREPRAPMPGHLQIPQHNTSHRSQSRGRQPRRAESVSTYTTDTYTDYSSHHGGRRKSRRPRSWNSDTEDRVVGFERPLRYYPKARSRSKKRYYV